MTNTANTANRLRTAGVSVVFGLIAIACSGATVAEVAVAPDAAVPAQVDQIDSTQEDEPEIEPVEATTITAVDTTTEAPPEAETSTTEAPAETTEAPAEVSPLFQGEFVDLNGQSIALADFEGEDVVLWFWAPW